MLVARLNGLVVGEIHVADEEPNRGGQGVRLSRVFGIGGALAVSVLGTPVWEAVKPGVGAAARFFLDTLTLGSNAVRDSVYADASLDPTALPVLHTLLVLSAIQWALLIACMTSVWLTPRRGRNDETARRAQRRFYVLLAGLVLISPFYAGQLLLSSESQLIWRTFHTNLTICAPYLSEVEMKNLKARYASMTGRAEYNALAENLQGLATTHGLRLKGAVLW